jgi:hypothetical protein
LPHHSSSRRKVFSVPRGVFGVYAPGAALAPVGLSDSVADPLISPDVSRFRLVSADDEGLVLGLGGGSAVGATAKGRRALSRENNRPAQW